MTGKVYNTKSIDKDLFDGIQAIKKSLLGHKAFNSFFKDDPSTLINMHEIIEIELCYLFGWKKTLQGNNTGFDAINREGDLMQIKTHADFKKGDMLSKVNSSLNFDTIVLVTYNKSLKYTRAWSVSKQNFMAKLRQIQGNNITLYAMSIKQFEQVKDVNKGFIKEIRKKNKDLIA